MTYQLDVTQGRIDEIMARLTDGRGQAMSDGDNSVCTYRTEDGNCCAIGAILPDSIFEGPRHEIEPLYLDTVAGLVNKGIIALSRLGLSLFTSIQRIHDEEKNWESDGSITAEAMQGFNEILAEKAPDFRGFPLEEIAAREKQFPQIPSPQFEKSEK